MKSIYPIPNNRNGFINPYTGVIHKFYSTDLVSYCCGGEVTAHGYKDDIKYYTCDICDRNCEKSCSTVKSEHQELVEFAKFVPPTTFTSVKQQ